MLGGGIRGHMQQPGSQGCSNLPGVIHQSLHHQPQCDWLNALHDLCCAELRCQGNLCGIRNHSTLPLQQRLLRTGLFNSTWTLLQRHLQWQRLLLLTFRDVCGLLRMCTRLTRGAMWHCFPTATLATCE